MKTAGVCLDNWKLPIFRKHLDAAGYMYDDAQPFMKDSSINIHQWMDRIREALCKIEAMKLPPRFLIKKDQLCVIPADDAQS